MFTMCIMQPLKGDLRASPLCRGLDVAGRNHLVARFQILGAIVHPTAPLPPRFHIYGSIGSLVKPIVSCLMLLDIISLEKNQELGELWDWDHLSKLLCLWWNCDHRLFLMFASDWLWQMFSKCLQWLVMTNVTTMSLPAIVGIWLRAKLHSFDYFNNRPTLLPLKAFEWNQLINKMCGSKPKARGWGFKPNPAPPKSF